MKAYSTREVADLLGIPAQRVRWLVRSGVVAPRLGAGGRFEFSFQDLVLLRTAKGLADANLKPRKILNALRALAEQLPADRPLSAVRVQIDGNGSIVRDNTRSWNENSKRPLAPRRGATTPERTSQRTRCACFRAGRPPTRGVHLHGVRVKRGGALLGDRLGLGSLFLRG